MITPSLTRYTVDITNQPRRFFDRADHALRHAAESVYISTEAADRKAQLLLEGQRVEWAYGFVSATVYPPQDMVHAETPCAGNAAKTRPGEDGGPAFPMIRDMRYSPDWDHEAGMTLRDYFAAKAMAAMTGGTWPDGADMFEIARRSYAMADSMLKARSA